MSYVTSTTDNNAARAVDSKKISSLIIPLSNLDRKGALRNFTINGDVGASFMMQVINSSGFFYDFINKTFVRGFNSNTNFKATLTSSKYQGSINFPSTGVEKTFTIILIPDPTTDTELTLGRKVINRSLTQLVDTTVTLVYKTSNTDKYSANPPVANKTSVGNPTKKYKVPIDLTSSVITSAADDHAYGLRLTRQPRDTDFVFEVSTTVNGAVSPASTNVVLASIDDLVPGMVLASGASSGTPIIKKIDKSSKTVTISSSSTFSHGATVKFEAVGPKMIYMATGLGLSFNKLTATSNVLTKTIRATSSTVNISLNNTKGLSGGGHVSISGPNVVNTSANKIQNVTQDPDGSGSDGVIQVQVAQTTALAVGTTVKFKGSTDQIDIVGNMTITSYPNVDRTINFKLDNFITPGTQA